MSIHIPASHQFSATFVFDFSSFILFYSLFVCFLSLGLCFPWIGRDSYLVIFNCGSTSPGSSCFPPNFIHSFLSFLTDQHFQVAQPFDHLTRACANSCQHNTRIDGFRVLHFALHWTTRLRCPTPFFPRDHVSKRKTASFVGHKHTWTNRSMRQIEFVPSQLPSIQTNL